MSVNDTTIHSTESEIIHPLIILLTLCICVTFCYKPIYYRLYYYTHPLVLKNATTKCGVEKWADDETVSKTDLNARKVWLKYELVTYESAGYKFDMFDLPINPYKKTWKKGRGLLGKYGANHAADPIVTRLCKGKYQMIAVVRSDCNLPAIPGGMVDAGESYTATLNREIIEEATEENYMLKNKFEEAVLVYTGYADDPRCTDTAWIETAVVHVHLNEFEANQLILRPSKDGETLQSFWYDITLENMREEPLYGTHNNLVMKAMNMFDNTWKSYEG